MSMGAWSRFNRNGSVGPITTHVGPKFYKEIIHGQVTRDNFDIISRAVWCRNVYVAGGIVPCDVAGDIDLPWWTPTEIPNEDGILSSFVDAIESAVVRVKFRYRIKMSDAAVSFTPKLWRGSDLDDPSAISTVATITGQAACTAVDDDFGGANQYQHVFATLPGGGIDSLWKAAGTVGGTPAPDLWAQVDVWHDVYVEFP